MTFSFKQRICFITGILISLSTVPTLAQTESETYLLDNTIPDRSITGVGDVNGDSVSDIAVSNYASQDSAWVFSGIDGTLLHALDNPIDQNKIGFGCSMAGVGDVNGDLIIDIAVGSKTDEEKVFFFSGSDGFLIDTSETKQSGSDSGMNCSITEINDTNNEFKIGDVNGDSVPDFALEDGTEILVISGTDGELIYTLDEPIGQYNRNSSYSKSNKQDSHAFHAQENSLLMDTASVNIAYANACLLRTKYVKKGKWRTLESFWNAKGTTFFREPAGAKIKVRYGVGWFGKDRQKQTLDGSNYKKLSVGSWSVTRARMQMKVAKSGYVTYAACPGGVGLNFPGIRF